MLLDVQSVTKRYRRGRHLSTIAVEDVSFSLDRARTVAVVGESGAGKSTLGRMIVRLVQPDSGRILLDGADVTALPGRELRAVRRRVQMIFQDPFNSLDPRCTIGTSVAEPLKVHFGVNRTDRERRAMALLDRVRLNRTELHRLPRELSGGQLQRVAIARALAVEPDLIVCDEPVAALDASIRAQVLNLLLDLQDSDGLAYMFITHDLSTVRVFAHDILVMQHGRVVERGGAADVFDRPSEAYTRELLRAVPELDLS